MEKETKHIIIADDDADDCQILTMALKEIWPEATIHCSSNGIKLMMQLNRVKPYAIFLDINMPVKNGIECLQEIRSQEPPGEKCRIVMYSTSTSQKDIDMSYEKGANYYIEKPRREETIKQLMLKLVKNEKFLNNQIPPREAFLFS
jgi:DNA-binding NarL/FixJ family response regulator